MLKGVAASPGIGIGTAFPVTQPDIAPEQRSPWGVGAELRRFERAVDVFCTEISNLAAASILHFGESEAGILIAQIVMIQDTDLHSQIRSCLMEESCNVEQAVCQVFGSYIHHFSSLEEELMQARAADFRDMKRRLLGILLGRPVLEPPVPPPGSILVAEELHPSIAAAILPQHIEAIATADGHPTSHAAILARALGVPMVVSAPDILVRAREGEGLIVDGGNGEIILRPTSEQIHRYRQRLVQQTEAYRKMVSIQETEALTRDGVPVRMSASLDSLRHLSDLSPLADCAHFSPNHHLLRDEGKRIGEQQQFLAYRALLRALKGKPVTISLAEPSSQREADTERDRQLTVQLRALLRASAFGSLRIAVPMVHSLDDLRRARSRLEECKIELLRSHEDFNPSVPLGIMVETPAAAVLAASLAQEADFFCLSAFSGCFSQTSSLGQGSAEAYNLFHPATLALLQKAIEAGQGLISVSACGQLAADPMMLPFLVGCGVREICVEPSALWNVRSQLGNLNAAYWGARIGEILALSSPQEVMNYIKRNWAERADSPEEVWDNPLLF